MKYTLIIWFSISIITMIFATCIDIKKRGLKNALRHIRYYYYPQFILLLCLGPVTPFMLISEYMQAKRLKSRRR